jgi:Tol biopolymer transport system component/tRNA A-37 threonylcarbamoyl transferase component Bud32
LAANTPDCFGPYEVVALLGAGGMGEVYRARDPRLNRQVAIKVLARAGADAVRGRRLLDEAQAASALNHPNIITVYDVGMRDETPFIVSELVEGASLREMLARAPLPIRDALDLGLQMAEGLAAAHHAGIVHRDFKPENVMVTRDGRVKILDFGLALVGTRYGPAGAVMEDTLTVASTIVGTVPYMSPEQARGAHVDYRTDQFSLGLTLYEMVAGRRAYSAETSAQVLAAIIEDEPEPIAKVNPRVPAPLRWLVERCLTKDPRQRYDSTADLARELRTLRDRLTESTWSADAPAQPTRRRRRSLLTAGAMAAVAAAGVLAGLRGAGERGPILEQYHFTPIATDAGYQASPAWSPDGKTLAYVAVVDGVLQIFARTPGSPTRSQVTHERYDCRDPFWSADSQRLYYTTLTGSRDGIRSILAVGGESEVVMQDVYRAALSPDGQTLAFFRNGANGRLRLFLSSPPGSTPAPYTRAPFNDEMAHVEATLHFSPDGSKLGAWVERAESNLALRASFWVIPMGAGAGAPYRTSAPIDDLAVGLAPAFSWLPDSRRIVSALPHPSPGMHLWLTDTERGASRLLTTTGGREDEPSLSPEGTRLALTIQQADYDLYQFSVEHPAPTVFLATSRNEWDPAWSPSGTELAFGTDRLGRGEIWLRSRDGIERPVVTPTDFGASPTYLLSAPAFSPDGQRIAFNRAGPEGMQIWITPVAGGTPVQLSSDGNTQDSPSWSPDGAWVAYAQAHGLWALVKMRVGARTASEVLVGDIDGSTGVQWSPGDGAWIAFNSPDGLSVVSPDGKTKRVLHEQPWMAFTWSADGQHLYGIRLSDDFQHLTFTSVDVNSGAERVLGPDFMPLPVSGRLVRGITRTSPGTFLASIVRVRSDVWLLEGFLRPDTLWDRLATAVASLRR